MKQALFAMILLAGIASCGNNPNTGDGRREDMPTIDEHIDNRGSGETTLGDTTSTQLNNAYNTDSAAGQGTIYDSSSNNKTGANKR